MIHGSKSMIAECIDRMRANGCDGCDRQQACADLFRRLGLRMGGGGSAAPVRRRPAGLFTTILRDIVSDLEKRMMAAAPPPPSPFRRAAEEALEALLPAGEVRMEALAQALGCSRQTLYRRLRSEGVTFEALLDRVRRRLAMRLLRDERLSVKETAYRLGFADPAAFSRAFKRWTGSSPRPWRDGGVSPGS